MEQQAVSNGSGYYSQIDKGYDELTKQTSDGKMKLSVLVSGAHCAACIYKIENSLKKHPEVTHARLNFSTGFLAMEWTGEKKVANDLIEEIENLGYGVRPYDVYQAKEKMDSEDRFLLLCLGVAGFSMGNIMLLSVGLWATTAETMGMATRDFMHWISALIAIPTVIYSGRPFFYSAYSALKSGRTNMDVPISVGLVLASTMSLFETLNHGEHAYFDSAVMLIFFLLIGRYFDFRARKKAQSSASALLSSLSGFATVIENGKPKHVLIRDIAAGQILRIASGDKFPADGKIIEGMSDVDLSLITGETIPASLSPGSLVYAGTINISAPLLVEVTKKAEDSLLADIARLMDRATQSQALYVRLADKVAKLYTPVVHLLALITFLVWWGIIDAPWQSSLMTAITVLIITCPCALGLAVPVVQVLANNKLMKMGILVKSGDALERLAAIDRVIMDKTGTLTIGNPCLVSNPPANFLSIAASLAAYSNHPLSLALTQAYQGPISTVANIKEYPGEGLEGDIEGQRVRLGSRKWCGDKEAAQSEYLELWLNINSETVIAFLFADQLRPDSHATITHFQNAGLPPALLSGDRKIIVEKVAATCGIKTYKAEQTPAMKLAYLEELKRSGNRVLMVGDGLNDAPCLAAANISMAPGTAIDISQNTADIIFMGDNFNPVYQTYETALFTQKIVRQNFYLAVAYNVVAIPVAALGFLTPFLAALAMSGSSLVVILNSFRIARQRKWTS